MNRLPQVSIIWLNYNGMKIKDVIMESLNHVFRLDYPGVIELFIVDNGSTDGSRELIERLADKLSERRTNMEVKKLFLDKNYGFVGANNIAYRQISRSSEYVVLMNNDYIPTNYSLHKLVEYMEGDPSVGAIQGIHVDPNDKNKISHAGGMFTNLLFTLPFLRGHKISELNFPIKVSYTSGCYTVYRVSSLHQIGLYDYLFEEEFFAYFDDIIVGLKMWQHNIKSITIPISAGIHLESATFSARKWYYDAISKGALYELVNYRDKKLALIYLYLLYSRLQIQKIVKRKELKGYNIIGAFREGRKIGKKLRNRGLVIDFEKVPIIRIPKYAMPITVFSRSYAHKYFLSVLNELKYED